MERVKGSERLKKMNGKVKSVLPDWLTPHFSAAPGTSSQGDGFSLEVSTRARGACPVSLYFLYLGMCSLF